jgi:hypothetical protein
VKATISIWVIGRTLMNANRIRIAVFLEEETLPPGNTKNAVS